MRFIEFLRKETKEKPIQSNQVYFAGQQMNQEATGKYIDIAKEGYMGNPLVRAIFNKQGDIFAGLPIILEKRGKDGWEEVSDHKIINLLKEPNDNQTGRQFLKDMFIYYRLAGYCYVKKMRSSDNKPPVMLYNIVPNAYTPIAGSISGDVVAFTVEADQSRITKKEVIYIKSFNPLYAEQATSAVQSAGILIDTYNAMMKWNLGLMQNAGVPSILIKSQQKLQEEQKDSILKKFSRDHAGWKNSGKPIIQDGSNFEVSVLGIKPTEAQFLESMQELWRQICVALDMPPEIMGSEKGTTFNNRDAAMKDVYMNLILPIAEIILGTLNMQLVKEFEPNGNYRLSIDKAQIEALHESQDAIWKRSQNAFNTGLLNVQEARDEMGFGSENVPHAETFFMPSNKIPLENV